MNARRIQFARLVTDSDGDACRVRLGSSSTVMSVYDSFLEFLRNHDGKVKFSRRPFAGAIRETFVRKDTYEDFKGETTGVELCEWRCNQKLGVGEKTRKFTVWYKPI